MLHRAPLLLAPLWQCETWWNCLETGTLPRCFLLLRLKHQGKC